MLCSPEKVWRRAHHRKQDKLKDGHPVYRHGFLYARISHSILKENLRMTFSQEEEKDVQLTLFLYAVMACAKMLDTAARREDCRVACTMGDGAMVFG